jgi:hypothetical protein
MKIKISLVVFLFWCVSVLYAETVSDFSFDESLKVPSMWSSLPTNALSIGAEHFTDGNQGLKWTLSTESLLSIDMQGDNSLPIIFIPLYSFEENKDSLKFQFFAADHKTVVRETVMLLNFKGWRALHRHFAQDFGKDLPSGKFRFVDITFLKNKDSKRKSIWFDGVHLSMPEVGNYRLRFPGPYSKIDYEKGYFSNVPYLSTENIDAFITKIPEVSITPEHRMALEDIKKKFTYKTMGGVTTTDDKWVSAAKDSVGKYHIRYNTDGTVIGIPISLDNFSTEKSVSKYSKIILDLSIAAQSNGDNAARDSVIKFTQFLLDRGLGEGTVTYVGGYYDFWRKFLWMGWSHAMPIYKQYDKEHPGSTLANDVLRWVRWVYRYNNIYLQDAEQITGDYILTTSRFLLYLVSFGASDDEQIKDYISAVHFYENWTKPRSGGWGSGMRVDGTYFHHNSIHNGYSACMSQWVNDMENFKNTPFRITKEAYFNIAKGISTELLQCATKSKEAVFANTLCGRAPFSMQLNFMDNFAKLIKIGGDVVEKPFEPTMAATYNYLSKDRTFNIDPVDSDGFHQMNYGGMGVFRGTKGWVATMRGMTSLLWGTEIYGGANRFGKYQSYGVLEILYNKNPIIANSGYPKEQSWDWNVVPGTTVVRHSPNYWHSLQLSMGMARADEYQKRDFVGALSNGKSGIFAMDFEENPIGTDTKSRYMVTDNLKFKKTVFATNDILVCLGSDIQFAPNPTRMQDTLATNLFQFVFRELDRPALFFNNSEEITVEMKSETQLKKPNWVISPAGTGYFIPKQSGCLHIYQGYQDTPPNNVGLSATEKDYEKTLIGSEVAKAWISHPEKTNNKYEFVTIPQTTPKELKDVSKKLGSGNGIYQILRQDSIAHVVIFPANQLTAYAIFNASSELPGIIRAASAACLVMVQVEGGKHKLSICTPDLHYKTNIVSRWTSEPITVTLVLNKSLPIPATLPSNVTVTTINNVSEVSVILKDGLSTQIQF